jgi:hypothetical protein
MVSRSRSGLGPTFEQMRQALADMRLAATVREDAIEAAELAQRGFAQAREDLDRAEERMQRVLELLGIGRTD